MCLILLLKLFLLFEKPNPTKHIGSQKLLFAKTAFPLVQNWKQLSPTLPDVEVGNFKKNYLPATFKKLMAFELVHSPQQLFHSLQHSNFFKSYSSTKHTLSLTAIAGYSRLQLSPTFPCSLSTDCRFATCLSCPIVNLIFIFLWWMGAFIIFFAPGH